MIHQILWSSPPIVLLHLSPPGSWYQMIFVSLGIMILLFPENYFYHRGQLTSELEWRFFLQGTDVLCPPHCTHKLQSNSRQLVCTLTPCPQPRHPQRPFALLWAPLFLAYRRSSFSLSKPDTQLTSISHVWVFGLKKGDFNVSSVPHLWLAVYSIVYFKCSQIPS